MFITIATGIMFVVACGAVLLMNMTDRVLEYRMEMFDEFWAYEDDRFARYKSIVDRTLSTSSRPAAYVKFTRLKKDDYIIPASEAFKIRNLFHRKHIVKDYRIDGERMLQENVDTIMR